MHAVEIAVDVELQMDRGMISRAARRLGLDPVEPQIGEIERINERIDHANRIAVVDPVVEAFRQQRRLPPIRPRNKARHHVPRRFSRRIIAGREFSHSQGQEHACRRSCRHGVSNSIT